MEAAAPSRRAGSEQKEHGHDKPTANKINVKVGLKLAANKINVTVDLNAEAVWCSLLLASVEGRSASPPHPCTGGHHNARPSGEHTGRPEAG